MSALDPNIIQWTLIFEGCVIVLLFIHIAYFFRKYLILEVTFFCLAVLAAATAVYYSPWNEHISAPAVKKWAFLSLFLLMAVAPYITPLLKKIFRAPNIKKFLSRRGPLDELTVACEALSHEKVGALIAITRGDSLNHYAQKGLLIDSRVKRELLVSLFAPNTPTHDGAAIIDGDRIAACSAILPLSKRHAVEPNLGTRHLAALGISEHTDALAILVSEQTGKISLAAQGKLYFDVPLKNLKHQIRKLIL